MGIPLSIFCDLGSCPWILCTINFPFYLSLPDPEATPDHKPALTKENHCSLVCYFLNISLYILVINVYFSQL